MSARAPLSRVEFIALLAMLFATVAFSIDSMLPALPQIAAELSPDNLNKAQLILTSFVLGMGLGTFFTGPLSDTFGRKPVILAGAALYIVGAAMAFSAQGLEMILVARFVQGLGAAGPRIVGMAIVRDLYSGREMARIMSFVMMVFTLVPAVAPLLGSAVIAVAGWRGIFISFIGFAILSTGWLGLRQPESLPPEARRPLRLSLMWDGVKEMFSHHTVRLAILAQTLCFSLLFMSISVIQPVFDTVFGRADSFAYWFAAIALVSGSASLLNAALVMRFGMRKLASVALGAQVVLSTLMTLIWLSGFFGTDGMFFVFVAWQTTVFFQTGLTLGNLNAITMEPMGHIAGMAASVSGAVATVFGAALAIPVGLAFDGTPLPLSLGIGAASAVAFATMLWMKRVERIYGRD
ncbi:multidrug effflux MFS transporter [Thalassovita taeanensis]|uniref:MFS transporter, DHA1 family, bicyclomycin/chloramphenicol resistance protein n=1 Tax=Thalassovita taeanensis TaxID=657014 RepID=A0A1H8Z5G1_9RHOB|nr:multidrug effflux MFS transporter [Thalassovita taeanensis]SEP59660.1 MFS transporter, DHA1 family, bicyclomycin/chloramphenicol resistance protein [Thalassovita taeanensis]